MTWWFLIAVIGIPVVVVAAALGLNAAFPWISRHRCPLYLAIAGMEVVAAVGLWLAEPGNWKRAAGSELMAVLFVMLAFQPGTEAQRG
jgi:hypothetical protein